MKKLYTNIFDILDALDTLDASAKSTLKPKETKMAQSQTPSAPITVTTGSFIIGSATPSAGVSFASDPVQHFSAADARSECERLARLNPGKTFFFVEVKGGAYVPALQVHKF